MQIPLHVLLLIGSITTFVVVFELIRRGRLREEYSLVWLFSTVVIFFLALFRGSLQTLASFFGVEYGPSFIFMISIAFLLLVQMFHSMAVSTLSGQSKNLAQKLAILELQLKGLSGEVPQSTEWSHSTDSISEKLFEISQELSRQEHLPEMHHRALELALEFIGAAAGSMVIIDEKGIPVDGVLAYKGKSNTESPQNLEETVEKGLAGWVISNHRAALVSSTEDDPRWLKQPWEKVENTPRSAISVPLENKGRITGVLTLTHQEAWRFTENDLTYVSAVGSIISLAMLEVISKQEPVDHLQKRDQEIDPEILKAKTIQ